MDLRGHQHSDCMCQVALRDHMSSLQAGSKNSTTFIYLFVLFWCYAFLTTTQITCIWKGPHIKNKISTICLVQMRSDFQTGFWNKQHYAWLCDREVALRLKKVGDSLCIWIKTVGGFKNNAYMNYWWTSRCMFISSSRCLHESYNNGSKKHG